MQAPASGSTHTLNTSPTSHPGEEVRTNIVPGTTLGHGAADDKAPPCKYQGSGRALSWNARLEGAKNPTPALGGEFAN